MEAKNFEYVQVLANKPPGAQSILYWRPFGGATIADILEKTNQDQVKALRAAGWLQNQIEEYATFMKLTNYDLSEIDKIALDTFSKIKYVFVDLKDLTTEAAEQVKASMNQARRKYFLAQFSKPVRQSERKRFIPSPHLPSRPEVIDAQEKLETWLAELNGYFMAALMPIDPPDSGGGAASPGGVGPSGSGGSPSGPYGEPGGSPSDKSGGALWPSDKSRGTAGGWDEKRSLSPDPTGVATENLEVGSPSSWNQLFRSHVRLVFDRAPLTRSYGFTRSVGEIAADVRDTAYERQLSAEDTKVLAQKAVLQEQFMGFVTESVKNHLGIDDDPYLHHLRKPLMEITTQDDYHPVTGTMELMSVRIAEPDRILSRQQGRIVSGLGLDPGESTSIVVGRSGTLLETVKALGGSVEARSLRLDLPFDASDLVR